jgi:hypothetical protein
VVLCAAAAAAEEFLVVVEGGAGRVAVVSAMSDNLKSQVKVCPVCQREFHNRKKWQSRGLWPTIVYCSERCRRQARKAPPAR